MFARRGSITSRWSTGVYVPAFLGCRALELNCCGSRSLFSGLFSALFLPQIHDLHKSVWELRGRRHHLWVVLLLGGGVKSPCGPWRLHYVRFITILSSHVCLLWIGTSVWSLFTCIRFGVGVNPFMLLKETWIKELDTVDIYRGFPQHEQTGVS